MKKYSRNEMFVPKEFLIIEVCDEKLLPLND